MNTSVGNRDYLFYIFQNVAQLSLLSGYDICRMDDGSLRYCCSDENMLRHLHIVQQHLSDVYATEMSGTWLTPDNTLSIRGYNSESVMACVRSHVHIHVRTDNVGIGKITSCSCGGSIIKPKIHLYGGFGIVLSSLRHIAVPGTIAR